MAEVIPYRFRLRGGTASEWTTANTILLAREPGVETDTGAFKIGDGVTGWNALPYTGTNIAELVADLQADASAYADAAGDQAVIDAGTYTDTRVTAVRDGTDIADGTNLDTLRDPGLYYQDGDASATLLLGYPIERAGVLQVLRWATSTHRIQVYIPWNMDGFYHRRYYAGSWGAWTRYDTAAQTTSAIATAKSEAVTAANSYTDTADTNNRAAWAAADTALESRAKSYTDTASWYRGATTPNQDWNTITTPGYYDNGAWDAASTAVNAGVKLQGGLWVLRASSIYVIQVQHVLGNATTGPRTLIRSQISGGWSPWRDELVEAKAYTDTKVDASSLGNVSLDTILTPGRYYQGNPAYVTTANGYPAAASGRVYLEVKTVGTTDANLIQVLTVQTGAMYKRHRYNSLAWTAWMAFDTDGKAYTDSKVHTPVKGRLSPADYPGGLNTVTAPGTYDVWTGTDATTLALPYAAAGTLKVWGFGSYLYQQFTTMPSGGAQEYLRFSSNSGTSWGSWTSLVNDAAVAPIMAGSTATWTAIKNQIISEKYIKATNLTATQDWDTVTTDGLYKLTAVVSDWAALHMPGAGRYVLRVEDLLSGAKLQTATLWSTTPYPRVYVRGYSASGWTAWREIDPDDKPEYLTATSNLNDLSVGRKGTAHYQIAVTPTDSAAQNFPEASARGRIVCMEFTSNHKMQVFYQWSATTDQLTRIWHRNSVSGVWTPWTSPDAQLQELTPRVAAAENSTPGSGFKVVGLPATAGHASGNAGASGTYRIPLDYVPDTVEITRVKVRLRNIEIRGGTTRAGTITLDGVWLGVFTSTGTFTETPVQVAGPTTFDGAAGWESDWVEVPGRKLTDKAISYAYATANSTTYPWHNLGNGWYSTSRVGPNTGSVGMSTTGAIGFAVDLIVETPSTTPVVATFGDSNSVGVGAKAMREAWGTAIAKRLGAIPQLLGSSGDTVRGSTDTTRFKWNRFPGLERADTVLWALGQNDVGGNYTAESIIADLKATVPKATKLGRAVYTVSLMPRTADTFDEALRRTVNTALADQKSLGTRGYLNMIPAMSTDDDTIIPAYNADNTHLNAAGHAAVGTYLADTYQITTTATRDLAALKTANPADSRADLTVAAGDSLTVGSSNGTIWPAADSWPAKLDTALEGTVINQGQSGATVDELLLRLGAIEVFFTLPNGTLALGGTTALTTRQVLGCYPGRRFTVNGWIAGKYGILEYTSAGAWNFINYDTAGTLLAPGHQRFTPDTNAPRDASWVVMIGRNDVTGAVTGLDSTVADHVVGGVQRLMEWLTPRSPRIMLAGVTTRTNEYTGSENHNTVMEINARIRDMYPGRYKSLQAYLTDPATLTAAGITPTAEDTTALSNGTIPPSLMDTGDTTHFSKATATLLAERFYAPYLLGKGWR